MFLQWLQVLYLTLSLGRSRLGSITAIAKQRAVPSLVSSACGLGLFVPGNRAHVASCLCAVPIWPRASWQGTQAAGPGGQAGWQVEKNASHAGTIEAWLPTLELGFSALGSYPVLEVAFSQDQCPGTWTSQVLLGTGVHKTQLGTHSLRRSLTSVVVGQAPVSKSQQGRSSSCPLPVRCRVVWGIRIPRGQVCLVVEPRCLGLNVTFLASLSPFLTVPSFLCLPFYAVLCPQWLASIFM